MRLFKSLDDIMTDKINLVVIHVLALVGGVLLPFAMTLILYRTSGLVEFNTVADLVILLGTSIGPLCAVTLITYSLLRGLRES